MEPIPYAHIVPEVIFACSTALFLVVQLRLAIPGLLRRLGLRPATGVRADRGSLQLVLVTTAVGIIGAFLLAGDHQWAAIAPSLPFIRWIMFVVGCACIVTGTLARQWAISTLGKSFTLDVRIADGQRVVTSGPYRWVRHPSYTADLLAFAGLGLALGNWLSLIAVIVLPLLGLIGRIYVEEAALRTGLGDAYRDYAATRKRLLPHVW